MGVHPSVIFFTSDSHFHHKNVIKYCGRPFHSLDEMNSELIRHWNSRVGATDTVYHLGDFCFGKRELLAPTLQALNGYKILIRGNHDRTKTAMLEAGFAEVHDCLELELEGHRLYLSHIPVTVAADERRAKNKYPPELTRPPPPHDYFLCGHVHELWARQGNVINVGVDVRDFEPKTLEELAISSKLSSSDSRCELVQR